MFRQSSFELAEGGFDTLADRFAEKFQAQSQWSFGVFLALSAQGDTSGVLKQVFLSIIGIGTVAVDDGLVLQFQRQFFEGFDIGGAARSEHELDWMTTAGDEQMHFETEKVAFFAGAVAAMFFAFEQFAASDADIVARGQRHRIDGVVVAGVVRLEQLAQ